MWVWGGGRRGFSGHVRAVKGGVRLPHAAVPPPHGAARAALAIRASPAPPPFGCRFTPRGNSRVFSKRVTEGTLEPTAKDMVAFLEMERETAANIQVFARKIASPASWWGACKPAAPRPSPLRAMSEVKKLPPWAQPTMSEDLAAAAYPLRMMNSLTRTKVRGAGATQSGVSTLSSGGFHRRPTPSPPLPQTPFVPIEGRRVLWYMCGPTVYDVSHMGHARCVSWWCFVPCPFLPRTPPSHKPTPPPLPAPTFASTFCGAS